MKSITTVIIDDERGAREEIKRLLSSYTDFEIVGEAKNAAEAKTVIESLQPDILFLDIQMPQVSGFDLLESLGSVPQVIFTTAFDQYAVKAFEVNALDYLMKPIREERFEKAIVQARLRLITTINDRQFFVKDKQQYYFISWNKVHMITSMDNYARLYFDQKNTFLKTSLNQLEKKLDPDTFFRINRAQIINLHYIKQITTATNGRLIFTLRTGDVFEASDRQSVKFKNLKIT